MPACKGCGAPIMWIETAKGKPMPVDPRPIDYWLVQGGKEKLVTQDGEIVSCTTEPGMTPPNGRGYVPHWSTCPAAERFKR